MEEPGTEPGNNLLKDHKARIKHDFQMLNKQQAELQQLREENKDVSVLLMRSKYAARSYADVSLFCFTVTNPLRQNVISIVMNPWFDRFILAVIVLNCIQLALDDPGEAQTELQFTGELIFLIIFTIEMFMRILAMGFALEANSYLRDPWNVLDFIVVIVGWAGTFVTGGNISAVRTIRILRPLRTINSIPKMKVLVNSIINSIPMLLDIFIMFNFLLLVFGIVGTQTYEGLFRQKCFDGLTREVVEPDDNELCRMFDRWDEYETDCGDTGCESFEYWGKWYKNPNYGVTSFDNILLSFLTVFTAITLEGWTDVMYMGREVSENKYINDFYFVIMIAIGAFFLINLIVAVQYDSFGDAQNEQLRFEAEQVKLEGDEDEDSSYEPKSPTVEPTTWRYKWYEFRKWMYKVVQDPAFDWIITFLIIINTAFMASEYYPMSSTHTEVIEIANTVLTFLFLLEMILKLIGLGFRGYISDKSNIFDGILVTVGIIERSLQGETGSGVIALRAFRLFRVFKLAKSWKGLAGILEVMKQSLNSVAYLGLLCLLCMFIFALMGMQFFGKKIKDPDGQSPRANFDSIGWAMTTIFQILTGENWNEVMYQTINQTTWTAALYFVGLILIGNYIIFNLFLAILLQHFSTRQNEEDDDEDEDLQQEENMQKLEEGNLDRRQTFIPGQQSFKQKQEKGQVSFIDKAIDQKRRDNIKQKLETRDTKFDPIPLMGKSLYIFGPNNPIRKFLKQVILHPYFDSFIYGLIATSSVMLALDEPNVSTQKRSVLDFSQKMILVFFILEFLVKIIVMNFIFEKKAYMKRGWNRLDFFIVLVGIIDWIISASLTDSVDLSSLRALRALRALRPLRMVSRNEGMKKVVTSVMRSLPAVGNVILISLLFYLIFGILGVIFFKGSFYSCTDPNIEDEDDCIGWFISPTTGIIKQRKWRNSDYHFDNVLSSMLTLFEISTLEQWPDYMYTAIDAVGPHKAPKRDHQPAAALYFIAFIFSTTFFIMNLFVGVVIEYFNKIQEELNGSFFLSSDQKQWVKTQKLLMKVNPIIMYIEPENRYRKPFYQLVRNPNFEYGIMWVIIVNTIFMCTYHYDMPSAWETTLRWANIIFVLIFLIEFVLKIIGLGFRYYFADNWNRFDFIVLILSILSLNEVILAFNATIIRSLRIVRLFRIIKVSKGLRRLFHTLMTSLPSLVNVGALLLLLFFVYGVAGMDLFGHIKENEFITKHTHFRHFYDAVMTLFRASTGESWNGIMHDTMQDEDDGNCKGIDECGAIYYAIPYWVSFMVIASFVFLNIFIAVILENFSDINKNEEQIELSPEDLRKFQDVWKVYAPYADHFIPTECLFDLLNQLDAPLGFKGQQLSKLHLLKIIAAFDIRDHRGKVHFAEVLWVLAGTVSGTDMKNATPCDAIRNISKNLPKLFPSLPVKPNKEMTELLNYDQSKHATAAEFLACLTIQYHWRKYIERTKSYNGDERRMRAQSNLNHLVDSIIGGTLRDSFEQDSLHSPPRRVSRVRSPSIAPSESESRIESPQIAPSRPSRSTTHFEGINDEPSRRASGFN